MKPYPSYKPTGLKWLPEVPQGWNCRKFKYLFTERSEKGFPNEPLLAATQNHGVILKTEYENRTVTAEKGLEMLKLVKIGDFVISLRSFEGGIELSYRRGIISPAYTIIFSNGELKNGYFKWLGKSAVFIQLLKTCVTGIREGQNIDYGRLRVSGVPVPPPDEQKAIVSYLDAKTAKFDRLIKLKEREIELLQEKKQAVIEDKVSQLRGQEVPLEFVARPYSNCGFNDLPLLSVYLNLGVVRFDSIKDKRANATSEDVSKYQLVKPGDLVMNNQQAWRGSVGVSKLKGIVSPAYVILRLSKDWDMNFANYYFRSRIMVDEYVKASRGVGSIQRNLIWPILKTSHVHVPRLDEQRKIAAYLDTETAKTDKAIDAVARQIALLKEYRTRLISDAVTGRIDLREAVA